MNRLLQGLTLCYLLSVFYVLTPSPAQAQEGPYNTRAELEAIQQKIRRGENPWASAYRDLIKKANSRLSMKPRSVVDNGAPAGAPSGSEREHYHGSDKTYVTDGVARENGRKDDRAGYAMADAIEWLGMAYALSGEDRYARKAIDLLHHWALDKKTYMVPTTESRGPHTPRTNGGGSAPLYIALSGILHGAHYVSGHPYWNQKGGEGAFSDWTRRLFEDGQRRGEPKPTNHRGMFNHLMMLAASYLEDGSKVDWAVSYLKNKYLGNGKTIRPNGMMRRELSRRQSLRYSMIALKDIVKMAEIARTHGYDLYRWKDGAGSSPIRRALDFHAPFLLASNPEAMWRQKVGKSQPNDFNAERHSAVYELGYSAYRDGEYLRVARQGRPFMGGVYTVLSAKRFVLGGGSTRPSSPVADTSPEDSSPENTPAPPEQDNFPGDPTGEEKQVITIRGQGPLVTYTLRVEEELEKSTANGATINKHDELDGTAADGHVGGGADSYLFVGDITGFEASNYDQIKVLINGERVNLRERV